MRCLSFTLLLLDYVSANRGYVLCVFKELYFITDHFYILLHLQSASASCICAERERLSIHQTTCLHKIKLKLKISCNILIIRFTLVGFPKMWCM